MKNSDLFREALHQGQLAEADDILAPSQIAFWFDASEQGRWITVTGQGVSAWTDRSGNGCNASQGTDALRPPFSMGDRRSRGQPCVLWPDSLNAMRLNIATGTGPTWGELFVVLAYKDGSDGTFDDYNGIVGGTSTVNSRIIGNKNTANMDTGAGGAVYRYKNGSESSSNAVLTLPLGILSFTTNSVNPDLLGAADTSANRGWQGPICEMIATTALGAQTRRNLIGQLAWKWDIQDRLVRPNPYMNYPPMHGGQS